MNADEFLRRRQADWKTLSDLLDAAQRRGAQLSPEEIDRLGTLYRAAAADLALAQRDFPGRDVTAYLNQLVARGHATIYRSRPLSWERLRRFVVAGFPGTVRAHGRFILAAALVFLLPGLLAAFVIRANPAAARWLLPPEVQALEATIREGELWTEIPVEERPYVSSFIMRNNIQVSFLAFGFGVLGGILTLWVLAFNGLMLGGVTGLTAVYGIGWELWAFVIGHGVIELSVIVMAGGAGLSLGWAVLQPGLLRRRDALALAARRSVRLMAGAVPLLVLAGLIEGFISPSEAIPVAAKWGVGLGSGVLLYGYLLFSGRGSRQAPGGRLSSRRRER